MLSLTPTQQRWIVWTLRIVVACQLIGAAGEMRETETPLFKLIAGHPDEGAMGYGEVPALQASEIASYVFIALAGVSLLWPMRWLMYLTAAWFLFDAALATYLMRIGGEPFALIPIAAHAARICAPLALGMLWRRSDMPIDSKPWPAWEWMLRITTALTFATHGYEALMLNRVFTDYLIIFSHYFPAGHLEQDSAETILRIIGVVDIAVAMWLLVLRSRALAIYMAFWGILTAFSRIVCEGGDPLYASYLLAPLKSGWDYAWFKTLIRAANGGLPAVLFLYWSYSKALPNSLPAETSHDAPPDEG